jgi:hypothetical protein
MPCIKRILSAQCHGDVILLSILCPTEYTTTDYSIKVSYSIFGSKTLTLRLCECVRVM